MEILAGSFDIQCLTAYGAKTVGGNVAPFAKGEDGGGVIRGDADHDAALAFVEEGGVGMSAIDGNGGAYLFVGI